MRALWRLLRYAGPYWRHMVMVLAAMAAAVLLEVLRPWPMKVLVDQVIGGQPLSRGGLLAALPGADRPEGLLTWVAVATVAIFLAGTLVATIQAVVGVRFGQRMVYDLAGDLFLHLQRLSLLFHSHRPVGDSIARVTADPYGAHLLVNGALLPLLQSGVSLAAMFGVMWALDPTLTLLSLAVTPFLVLAIAVFGGPMKTRTRRRLDLEGRMIASVQQALAAIPVVQAFTREELEHARFRRYAQETAVAYTRATVADMWFKLAVGLVTTAGTAAVMWVGGLYVLEGRISVGTVLVFLSYLASLYTPLNALTYTASTLQHARANAERVIEILDTPPDVRDGPDARDVRLRGHVVYEDVTFGYAADRPVLRGVSLEARPGEVVAVVGPTGAGKTTLVNLLLRFFDPWSGRVTIDGHDVRALRVRTLREQVAVVLQEPFIFPLTIAENIGYGRPAASRADIAAAAAAAHAAGFIEALPEGHDTLVGERGMTLSGGEKQRLAIARAFLKNAPVLILDEPTSALDARTERLLLEALARLMAGRTTFIIAHRLSTIQAADRILVLTEGAIVQQGRHADLVGRGGLYATLYRTQFGGSAAGVAAP
ncbi:MAG TPA: ABC transporter ATP-binding protein [Methylomirabilota bacterium]|nr:ABC transporter ATP-binding protein [Methylomirabilota bacterium]